MSLYLKFQNVCHLLEKLANSEYYDSRKYGMFKVSLKKYKKSFPEKIKTARKL